MEEKLIAFAKISPDIATDASEFVKDSLFKEIKRSLCQAKKFGIRPIGQPKFRSYFSLDSKCQSIELYRLIQKTKGNRFGYFLERVFNTRRFPWHYLLRN